jgi:SNF2 family DNA or RNA helicase
VARRRFLDSLKSKNEEDEVCLICSDVEKGQIVLTHCGHLYHEHCLRVWSSKAHTTTCPVCRASLRRENAWQRVHLKAPLPEPEKVRNSEDMDIDEDTNGGSARTRNSKGKGRATVIEKEQALEDIEGDADPSSQLNYLPPEEVETIKGVPLQNAALGSKLDMITRHVIHLRDKHARAIRDADEPMTNGDPSSASSSASDGNGKARARESTPPNGGMFTSAFNDLSEDSQPTEAKILIYSGWQYACEVLASAFAREKIGYVRLETSAGNSAKQKEKAVVEFKENPDVSVFILHAQSQAAGLVGVLLSL